MIGIEVKSSISALTIGAFGSLSLSNAPTMLVVKEANPKMSSWVSPGLFLAQNLVLLSLDPEYNQVYVYIEYIEKYTDV